MSLLAKPNVNSRDIKMKHTSLTILRLRGQGVIQGPFLCPFLFLIDIS